MLVCQASTMFPLGATSPAARAPRTKAPASVVKAAVRNNVRRVTVIFSTFLSPLTKQCGPAANSAKPQHYVIDRRASF